MAEDNKTNIIDQLARDISSDVGNQHDDEIEIISSTFDKTLTDALKSFNSSIFDDDGFIKKMKEMDFGDKKDKDLVKNVLNNLKHEYVDVQSVNHSELLLRRDMFNISTQMPEMRDVVYSVRDAIIECNLSTGEVSRSIVFENHQNNESYIAQAKEIEMKHNLLMAIKNFIVPRTLMIGEMYIHVVPFAKLFAELEAVREMKHDRGHPPGAIRSFRESIPSEIMDYFKETETLDKDENIKVLMESMSPITKQNFADLHQIDRSNTNGKIPSTDNITKDYMKAILSQIEVSNGSSVLMQEFGVDAFREVILDEYEKNGGYNQSNKETHFSENMKKYMIESVSAARTGRLTDGKAIFGRIPDENINYAAFQHIKGAYVKYLDSLRMVPIRMDRKVIGYYYISTTMDLQINPAQPNGIIDLSFQHYTRDKNLVDNLAGIIIKTFDKKSLEKNIRLKNEIAEIIMAHRFSEGRLSFIYIPENEVVRLIINEDENNQGHSILEPTLFPARMYLMLTLYNMMMTLNNTTTRIHYLRSSGLNKDYAAQIQRMMRKFQSRRITIDDIYSYTGVLNKVGGMGELVIPSGRGDYKALETETLSAVERPVDIEFLEQQRRQAISGTGVPALLVINAIDEVDFAKTLEMANTRYLSTVSSYKIDFNVGLTKYYQKLLKYCTDLEDDVIHSFKFAFNPVRQQELQITTEMIGNYNAMVEFIASMYALQDKMQDADGKPTNYQKHLRKEIAKKFIPQMDFDDLEEIIKRVELAAKDDELQTRATNSSIQKEDLEEVIT